MESLKCKRVQKEGQKRPGNDVTEICGMNDENIFITTLLNKTPFEMFHFSFLHFFSLQDVLISASKKLCELFEKF